MTTAVIIHVRIVNVFLIHRAKAIPSPLNRVHNTQGKISSRLIWMAVLSYTLVHLA